MSLAISILHAEIRAGRRTAAAIVADALAAIAARGADPVWIARVPDEAVLARARALDATLRAEPAALDRLALFGVPFAVKDNIDVAGMPTTAACPGYAYTPGRSATVVERLEAAGAILLGKTNLDQFATGLVGVRSPYGVPANPFDAAFVPGGSSSGSAVAVAAGLVSFALGTDTAGSGRVPAGFNNIVGLKPTRGALSAAGVVPACRSLDCVSVFALTCDDAERVHSVAAADDARDPFSRRMPAAAPRALPESFCFGVPRADQLAFFGDGEYAHLFAAAAARLAGLGGRAVEIDYAPFHEAAELLYSGPWVAERTAAVGDFVRAAPETAGVVPVTRRIVMGGEAYSAVDAFAGLYRLKALEARAAATLAAVDLLLLPTAGTIYRLAELEAEPVALNTNLGRYTNFVNLFDLSALAVPAGFRPDGLPFGVTFVAPAFAERALLALGRRWQADTGLSLGATGASLPAAPDRADAAPPDTFDLAVVGAHLSGQPLNPQLTDLGAGLVAATRTAPVYRLHALPGAVERPGLVRVAEGGAAIEVEVWRLPVAGVGRFMAHVAPPLAIGTVELADGRRTAGFVCEAYAVAGTPDITAHGGWRAWRRSQSPA